MQQDRSERFEQVQEEQHLVNRNIRQTKNSQIQKRSCGNICSRILVVIIGILFGLFLYQVNILANATTERHTNHIQNQPNFLPEKVEQQRIKMTKKNEPQLKISSTKKKLSFKPKQLNENPQTDVIFVDGQHEYGPAHRNNWRTFTYPTLGIPIPGNTYNTTKVAPQQYDRFDTEVNEIFKPYNNTQCVFNRAGNVDNSTQGGYVVCQNYITGPVVINVGIIGNDNFGCHMAQWRTLANHQFDCLVGQPTCIIPGGKHYFYNACIGQQSQQNDKHTFLSLQDMLKRARVIKVPIFLKISVNGGQYSGLKTFPTQYLQYIDQMIVQFHLSPTYPEQWGMIDIFRTLTKHLAPVNYHMNNNGCRMGRKLKSSIFSVTLVNRRLIKLKSANRSFKINPLNTAENPSLQSCYI